MQRDTKSETSVRGVGFGHRLVPALLVRDMDKTLEFYQRLGFTVTGKSQEEPPSWAEVTRDGIVFQFHVEPACGTPSEPVCSGTFYVYPGNVDALAKEFRGKVEFAWGPEVMDYGMREFGLQDPNGYFLAFTAPCENQ